MTERAKWVLAGMACVACCIPLVLGLVGATSGVAGAVGVWLGRYEMAVVAALALGAVVWIAARQQRPRDQTDSTPAEDADR